MKVYVMLTVDLNNNVPQSTRTAFYEQLKIAHWRRLKLTTTWIATFQDGITPQQAIAISKNDVAVAAKATGIRDYEACAIPSYQPPVQWVGNQ